LPAADPIFDDLTLGTGISELDGACLLDNISGEYFKPKG
jgi:hypothetical protein